MKNVMTWLPRIFAILFIFFLEILSLDSFSGELTIWQKLISFIRHLIPALVVGICLWIAWNLRLFGGLLFMVLGMIFTIYYGTYQSASHFSLISLPLFVIGILFMASQWWAVKDNSYLKEK